MVVIQKAATYFSWVKVVPVLTGIPRGRRHLGRSRRKWKKNIRVDLKEIEISVRLELLHSWWKYWRALVNTEFILRVRDMKFRVGFISCRGCIVLILTASWGHLLRYDKSRWIVSGVLWKSLLIWQGCDLRPSSTQSRSDFHSNRRLLLWGYIIFTLIIELRRGWLSSQDDIWSCDTCTA